MTGQFSTHVQGIRESARARVGAALAALGFKEAGDCWAGKALFSDGTSLPVHIVLPPTFPDALPEIFVRSEAPDRIAHVERSGKVCIAPATGTLIDADRPEDIVIQALSMATAVLQERNAPGQANEFASEFLAYWHEPQQPTLLSACPPNTVTGPIYLAKLTADDSVFLRVFRK